MNQKITLEFTEEQSKEFLNIFREIRQIVLKKGVHTEEKYMNINDFCSRYKMSKGSVYMLTAKRKLPFIKKGKKILFNVEETDRFMELNHLQTLDDLVKK